ncbi:MAG: DUF456 domain-containing protein [Xanthomonadaceae bacterium]|nr:DUF456 domain-containing protein [Xanthomonadaceae bacterium]
MEGYLIDALLVAGWLVAIALVIIGLAGSVLPALPGTPIILAGLVLIAWMNGFEAVGIQTLVWLSALTILSILLDFIATAEGARRFGAGRAAILGATVGLLVGMFFGLPGMLLGPFAGAMLGHWLGEASINASFRAGVGASIGVLVGTFVKLLISVIMIVWFVVAWLTS